MPTAVVDPFGNTIQACSISTSVKAKFGKDKFASEAEWAKHVKADAWNVMLAKMHGGEFKKNTILARAPGNWKMKYDGTNFNGQHKISIYTNAKKNPESYLADQFKNGTDFADKDWDFGPNMATLAQADKAVVNTPSKLVDWLDKNDNQIEFDDVVATLKQKATGVEWKLKYTGEWDAAGKPKYIMDPPKHQGAPLPFSHQQANDFLTSPRWEVSYKVGQIPDVPPAAGLPVSSTSKSVGALTNEDAATMFVKTKDKLAQEAGINIKGASGKLDELVYKTIADQTGYTPAEMLAKVEAYKGSGKKLSALKKKVLPKSGNPTKQATQKSVDNATAAVKKEEIKPEEVPQVWDGEEVAKAYIKAKDHVVANNTHGWTLYTKNPDFDADIHKWMQADLGPIKKQTADTAVADYIANHQKLSVLKKQMIKKGELTPQADTLKGKKVVGVDSPDELKSLIAKNDEAYADTTVAILKDGSGLEYQLNFKAINEYDIPLYEFKYPSGTVQGMSHNDLVDILKGGDYTIEYKIKPAPKETGKGQVGKTTENPKVVGAKQQLTPEVEHDIFLQWEGLNITAFSPNVKVYSEALQLSEKYGLGTDVLPIMRAVDKGKTAKFGFKPEQNKFTYENKVKEHLKNPDASWSPTVGGGSPISQVAETFGELPEDSDLFKAVSPSEMHDIALAGMKKPTGQESLHLRIYSGSSYHEINGHLRLGKSVETNVYAKSIQSSMSPLPENIVARRGTSLSGLGMHSQEQLQQAIGKTFVEPGFSSTAVGGSGQFSGQVSLVIQAPKGTQAVWLKPHSNISGENELLLAAGTKFKILKVEQKPGNWGSMTNVVTVRVIP